MPEMINFDSVAPYYDWLVRLVFGKSMTRAQSFFLNKVPEGSSVLVLGGGTGLWLNDLLSLNPNCKIVFVDSSLRMIDQARSIINDSGRIDFRLGNENSINGDDHFDVVVAYCYLDLFTDSQLTDVITTIRKSTTKGCQWIIVDFVSTSWWHSAMLFVMYIFFRFTTGLNVGSLPEWEQILKQANFIQIEKKLFYHNFIQSAVFIDDNE